MQSNYAKDSQNILRIAVSQNVGVLNPQGYNSNQMYAQNMVYEGLVKTDSKGNIAPSLATRWEIKDSNTTYIFFLRKNVKFSNGEDFNAYAVKKNFDSILKNRIRHSWSELALQIKEVKIKDDYTIILKLKKPYSPTLSELSLIRPYRFIAPSMIPNDLDLVTHNPKQPIGTGAYMLTNTQIGVGDTFHKNPYYWDKQSYHGIYFDTIQTKIILDPNAKLIALRAKQVDMIYGYDEIPIEIFKDINPQEFNTYTSPPIFTTTLVLNPNNELLQSESFRQALAFGIDKIKLIKSVYYGYQDIANTLFSSHMPYSYLSDYTAPTYNPAHAKEILQQLGYSYKSDGYFYKNDKRLRLSLSFIANNPAQKALSEILQAQFKNIGIFLELIPNEITIYRNKQLSGAFDLCFSQTWGVPYEPLTMLNSMRHVGHVDYVVQKNIAQKTQIDNAIQEIITHTDTKNLEVSIPKILKLLYQTNLYIPLTYQTNKVIANKEIKGIVPDIHAFEIPFWEFYK